MKTIVFRTEADGEVGVGHLVRCAEIARECSLNDMQCVMIGPSIMYSGSNYQDIFCGWHETHGPPNAYHDANIAAQYGEKNDYVFLLDSYLLGIAYQEGLLAQGCRWVQFATGLERKVLGDVIVSIAPGIQSLSDFGPEVARAKDVLLGPRYSIVRNRFEAFKTSLDSTWLKTVVVMLGGGDDRGWIKKISLALNTILDRSQRLVVVIGPANPNKERIAAWADSNKWNMDFQLVTNPRNVEEIMASADLAITAGGGATYEFAYLRKPMLIIPLANNQIRIATGWKKIAKAEIYLESDCFDSQVFVNVLRRLVDDQKYRSDMSESLKGIVDTNGARRVCSSIAKLFCNDE